MTRTPLHADPQLIAAITAAVAACLGASPDAVRLRRVDPVRSGGLGEGMGGGPAPGWPSPWAMAGRLAQMAGRHASARARKEGRR